MPYVYIIFSKRTKKKYVGCTKRRLKQRWREHKRANSLLGQRMRHLGLKSFKIRVLAKLQDTKNMYRLERYYINKLNTKHPNGYNMI